MFEQKRKFYYILKNDVLSLIIVKKYLHMVVKLVLESWKFQIQILIEVIFFCNKFLMVF